MDGSATRIQARSDMVEELASMPARRPWTPLLAMLTCASVALVACSGGSTTASAPAQTLTEPAYHFTLHIPAGWVILQQQDDPTADAPYAVTIGRANVSPDVTPSTLSLQVIKLSSPGASALVASVTKSSQYHPITIDGQPAYQSIQVAYATPPTLAPGQSSLPSATPLPNTPGTILHTSYDLITTTFIYTIDTVAVAGDNAEPALEAMVQSLTITS
jgi:hypothetical protein